MTGKPGGESVMHPSLAQVRMPTLCVSAAGHGEFFIQHTVARDICARMELAGETLTEAANVDRADTLVRPRR